MFFGLILFSFSFFLDEFWEQQKKKQQVSGKWKGGIEERKGKKGKKRRKVQTAEIRDRCETVHK